MSNVTTDEKFPPLRTGVKGQKLSINKNKTKELIIDFRKGKKEHAPVKIGTETIEEVNSFVYLGTTITSDLTWSDQCVSTLNKCQKKCTS